MIAVWKNEEFFRGNKGALRIPFLLLNYLEGQAAPQNSFVSNTSADSSLIGPANFPFSFQCHAKTLEGH